MTVSQLITKLQSLPSDAVVLTDVPFTLGSLYIFEANSLNSPIMVSLGKASQTKWLNGTGIYISADDWENYPQGNPATSVAAVYIGMGNGIIGPEWQQI